MRPKLLTVAAAALLFACSSRDYGVGIAPPPPPPPPGVDTSFVTVSIEGNAFVPAAVSVRAGRAVRWTNNSVDSQAVRASDGSFASTAIAPGAVFQRTFAAQGTFSYTNGAIAPDVPFSGTVSVTP